MVQHPVHIPRENYRGADLKKRAKVSAKNLAAMEIERAINKLLLEQTSPILMLDWMTISRASGYSYDLVAELGAKIQGGSGGITAIRHDLTYEQAMALNQKSGH